MADHGIRPDGKMIRELREQRGWTQEDLAGRVGYNKKTIENAEARKKVMPATLQEIAQALGVPMIRLVKIGDDEPIEAKTPRPGRATDTAIDIDLEVTTADGRSDSLAVGATSGAIRQPLDESANTSGGQRRKHTLLVVDDQRYVLQAILGTLKDEFTIHTAISTNEAERVFERHAIDIILTDQKMPGRSGVELLEWARTRSPQTIGLLMTGFAEYEDLVDAINRGHIYQLLRKPWKNDELRMTLRNAADKFDLERRYEQLVTELCTLNEQLEQRVADRTRELELLALTDPLTGLFNRRAALQLAGEEVKRHKRYPNSVALGIVDVDHFKNVNTVYHYPGGDAVLVALAQVLSSTLRDTDSLGRMGGEEFLVIARETDEEGAHKLGDRIVKTAAKAEIAFEGQEIKITVSAGFAIAGPGVPATYEDLYKIASAAVQEAKDKGRNRCVIRSL